MCRLENTHCVLIGIHCQRYVTYLEISPFGSLLV